VAAADAAIASGAFDAIPALRELIAWGLAALFLVLFGVKALLTSRRIRKLEER
jgi:hypothetical protein